jgi:hypothetical protein
MDQQQEPGANPPPPHRPELTSAEIEAQLGQFIGSENYYRHWTGALVYTDGVKAMAELCGAYWLIDAVASWQPQCRKDKMLRQIQFWTLRRTEDNQWLLCVERDTDDVAFRQQIEFSDFPLTEIKLYAAAGGPGGAIVLMLPTEY